MDLEPQDQDNARLRQLLAWKRHEQPPPGFFASFSSGVIAELECSGESPLSWWEKLQARLTGPAFACTYGAALGAALVVGIGFTDPKDNPEMSSGTFRLAGSPWVEPATARIPNLESRDYPALFAPAESSITRPVIRSGPAGFLMDQSPVMVERASFQFR